MGGMHCQDVDLKLDDVKLLTICYQNVIHVNSLLNFRVLSSVQGLPT